MSHEASEAFINKAKEPVCVFVCNFLFGQRCSSPRLHLSGCKRHAQRRRTIEAGRTAASVVTCEWRWFIESDFLGRIGNIAGLSQSGREEGASLENGIKCKECG